MKVAQLVSLSDNVLNIILIRMKIFLWQRKAIIFAIKKKSMFSLEKQMHYQRKCHYELGETKALCLLKFLLGRFYSERVSFTWAYYSTTRPGFSFVLLCTLNRCEVFFGVRKPSLLSYRNSSDNIKNGTLSPWKIILLK